jgi:RimJ/RimL family protein N-acetyltransferase
MSGIFVNRGLTKIDERNDPSRKEIQILWYVGSNMQNRDIRKFVEVIYRNFEELEPIRKLNHNRTEIKKVITSPTALTLVATFNKQIVSYVIGDLVEYNNRLLFHIYYLFTAPGYRNKGVATFLLNQLQDYADVYNCSALSLTYDTYNKKLTKFYISNGFTYDPELRSNQRHDMLVKYI